MNVLSLFDGISCGRIALERAGIKVSKYYASEVDKYATKVSESNYPNIIRIGDVRKINSKDISRIDLLIGGSPCQSFSFAGKRQGMSTKEDIKITNLKQYLKLKKEGFEFKGQSYLFWEYVRILKEVKPKYFLLENVKMLKKWQDIISETLGVEPVLINSNLVSAQNRRRLYWTNIAEIEQPDDKKVYLVDILEDKLVEPVIIKTIPHGYMKESVDEKEKYPSLCAQSPASKHLIYLKRRGHGYLPNKESLVEKTPALFCGAGDYFVQNNQKEWRQLYPIECERLQTLPDNYTSSISKTQRYKTVGNGWTVDVVVHILSYLPKKYKL